MRIYQKHRRNRILTGAPIGLVGGSGVAVGGGPQQWPVIENFEGDTIGETGTDIIAKDTHFGARAGAAVRAEDYDTLNPSHDGRFDQCFAGAGDTNGPYTTVVVPEASGFIPSEGGEVILEANLSVYGTGSQANFYFGSEDDNDGFNVEVYGNSYHYVKTKTGGSWDGSWKIGPYGIALTPFLGEWICWQVKYRYSDNRVQVRMFDLSNATPAWDSGWVTIGTVSSPSFSASKEHVRLTTAARNNTGATCGLAQVRIAHFATDGAGDGAAATHNYQVPS